MAKSANAKFPASGRSASAALAALSMLVTPAACSVTAVARMMKYAVRSE
jgi:hypothetical protein